MPDTPMPGSLAAETARRRTFAIISHPDAGKTTLTEKLLLYGGARFAPPVPSKPARATNMPPATGWISRNSAAFP